MSRLASVTLRETRYYLHFARLKKDTMRFSSRNFAYNLMQSENILMRSVSRGICYHPYLTYFHESTLACESRSRKVNLPFSSNSSKVNCKFDATYHISSLEDHRITPHRFHYVIHIYKKSLNTRLGSIRFV